MNLDARDRLIRQARLKVERCELVVNRLHDPTDESNQIHYQFLEEAKQELETLQEAFYSM
jgi:hypothetical protein